MSASGRVREEKRQVISVLHNKKMRKRADLVIKSVRLELRTQKEAAWKEYRRTALSSPHHHRARTSKPFRRSAGPKSNSSSELMCL